MLFYHKNTKNPVEMKMGCKFNQAKRFAMRLEHGFIRLWFEERSVCPGTGMEMQ
jgi:hypothetical protein